MPKSRPNCSVFWEPLSILLDDGLAELVRQHHVEVGVHKKEMPLDVDWDEYQTLENLGMLRILGARIEGKLIGYNSFIVRRHLHYRTTLHAMGDAIFVLKRYRHTGVGIEMIDKAERDLAAEAKPGYLRIWYHDKLDPELLGPVLKKRGYGMVEHGWDKMVRAG